MTSAASQARPALELEPTAPEFDEVYARYFDFVFRVVARLAGTTDAEDLVQEVFVVVHRRLPEFEGRARLTTWLFRIAHRVARAHARKQRMRRVLSRALAGERPLGHAPTGPVLVERAEQTARVSRALERLSWKKRTVLLLHEVEGWPCADIAERLGTPLGTVFTRLHHARRDLRKELRRQTVREAS